MTSRFTGASALVTAAAAGIGRATAQALFAQGARVVATDIDEDGLASLAAECDGIIVARMDVLMPDAIQSVVSRYGPFTVVVNAAGVVPSGTVLETDDSGFRHTLEMNVVSMHRVIRATLPKMLAAGSGSIINIASVASSIKGVPNRYAYSASKAAVIGLTKAIAADYVGQGIRCNAICPGTIDTPSLHGRLSATGDYDAARAAFVARQPMGRFGTAGEVAALAVYLASDDSAFTTGAIHVIDGGWTM